MRQMFEVLGRKSDAHASSTKADFKRLYDAIYVQDKPYDKQGQVNYSDLLNSPDVSVAIVDELLAAEVKTGLSQVKRRHIAMIVELLKFEAMPDRHDAIRPAHVRTFEWVFSGRQLDETHCHDFPNWLQSDQKLYWITGKPGAGKSTLMKFLRHDARTEQLARNWSDRNLSRSSAEFDGPVGRPQDLQIASFFFWISGSKLQKSKEGMLRSLLYQMLDGRNALIPSIFQARMQRCDVFGRDLSPLTLSELSTAINQLIMLHDRSFLIFVDGLDEFEGGSDDIIAIIASFATHQNVKLCVASRLWTAFSDAFETKPKLYIEYLTRGDIRHYVDDNLAESSLFRELEKHNAQGAEDLKEEVVVKAQGVFLWVYVVVSSLMEGVRDGDDLVLLKRRLDDLPAELEQLFDRIFSELVPSYAAQASEIFQFFRKYPDDSTLLGLYFTYKPLLDALDCDPAPMDPDTAQYYAKTMRLRVYSRCKCFIEAPQPFEPWSKLRYLHRTVRDYLYRPEIWARIVRHQPEYNSGQARSISKLMLAKTSSASKPRHPEALRYITPPKVGGTAVYEPEPHVPNTREMVLGELIFNPGLSSIANVEDRIMFLDSVDRTGRHFYSSFGHSGDWLDTSKMHASTDVVLQILDDDTQKSAKTAMNIFDFAVCARYIWYIRNKVAYDQDLLRRTIDGLPIFAFAIQKDFYDVQSTLLDAGAEPNEEIKVLALTPWTFFLKRLELVDRPRESREEFEIIVKLLCKYLECGAHFEHLSKRVKRTDIHILLSRQVKEVQRDDVDAVMEAMERSEEEAKAERRALEPSRQQNQRNDISKAKTWWAMILGGRQSSTL